MKQIIALLRSTLLAMQANMFPPLIPAFCNGMSATTLDRADCISIKLGARFEFQIYLKLFLKLIENWCFLSMIIDRSNIS